MLFDTWVSRQLRWIGRMVPPWLPHGTAIGNRVLKPIYKAVLGPRQERSEIWPGVVMHVNPCEGVDGNLFFSPQLYDRDERSWIDNILHDGHVFVDVGANLGVYSLWAARNLSTAGTVLAIEADPKTFSMLRQNMSDNPTVVCTVLLENTGVSDKREVLSFYRNTTGNSGASGFFDTVGAEPALTLQVEPLNDVIQRSGLSRIDFMKIDVEGWETRVLTRFFAECRPDLMPRYVLIEMDEGPRGRDPFFRAELMSLFASYSYRQVRGGNNSLFQLVPAHAAA